MKGPREKDTWRLERRLHFLRNYDVAGDGIVVLCVWHAYALAPPSYPLLLFLYTLG
ncbi:uncharacterized protein G2W53_034614 [Senna tora]|uniref:Uncharacterized protein n=1 Tax=Senna tora TaxID=362788 RepID=A0A834SZK6_9FABA|nr:uncharacterized protein G2W53_034614 [Senna tora]